MPKTKRPIQVTVVWTKSGPKRVKRRAYTKWV